MSIRQLSLFHPSILVHQFRWSTPLESPTSDAGKYKTWIRHNGHSFHRRRKASTWTLPCQFPILRTYQPCIASKLLENATYNLLADEDGRRGICKVRYVAEDYAGLRLKSFLNLLDGIEDQIGLDLV